MDRGGRLAVWDLAVGVGVLVIAAVAFYQIGQIPAGPAFARIGPKAIPYAVAAGLAVLGVILTIQALRGGWSTEVADDGESLPIDWRALFWLGSGLLLNVALIQFLGFIIASILMFLCVARAFGSDRILRDVVVAAVLTLVAYVGFDKLLGINIGAGILEGIL